MRSPDKIKWHASQCLQVTLLLIASTAIAQAPKPKAPIPIPIPTPPIQCPPGEVANPPNVTPPCYTPLPPEWTPFLDFYTQSMPQSGGSVPDPHYIPPIKPGEIFITVPIVWDLYQSQAAANANLAYYPVKGGMQTGDSYTAHLSDGPCFILIRHQTPAPDRTVLFSVALGDTSGTGATSINGTAAACATPQGGTPGHYTGNVTVRIW